MRVRTLPSYTQNKNVVDVPVKQVITLFDADGNPTHEPVLIGIWRTNGISRHY